MPSEPGAFTGLISLQAFVSSSQVKEFCRCVLSFGGLRLQCFSSLETFLVKVLSGCSKMLFFTTCLAIWQYHWGKGSMFVFLNFSCQSVDYLPGFSRGVGKIDICKCQSSAVLVSCLRDLSRLKNSGLSATRNSSNRFEHSLSHMGVKFFR